jgi:hypothetical protein
MPNARFGSLRLSTHSNVLRKGVAQKRVLAELQGILCQTHLSQVCSIIAQISLLFCQDSHQHSAHSTYTSFEYFEMLPS